MPPRQQFLHAAECDGLHPRGKRTKERQDLLALRLGHFLRWCGLRLPNHPLQPAKVAAKKPIVADLVLLAEKHDVASVDPLVHELRNFGRLKVSFLGERSDAPPQCLARMRAVSFETIKRLALIKFGLWNFWPLG